MSLGKLCYPFWFILLICMKLKKKFHGIEFECLICFIGLYWIQWNGLRIHLRASTNSKFSRGWPPAPPPPNQRGIPPLILSPMEAVIKLHSLLWYLHSLHVHSWLNLCFAGIKIYSKFNLILFVHFSCVVMVFTIYLINIHFLFTNLMNTAKQEHTSFVTIFQIFWATFSWWFSWT